MERSPYQQLRQLGYAINRFGNDADLDRQPIQARRSFDVLKRNVRSAQDRLKDYENAEFEQDVKLQIQVLPKAVQALEKTRDSLLKASEFELVGAVDVAHISSELDELIRRLS
jgi:hypothetical protein